MTKQPERISSVCHQNSMLHKLSVHTQLLERFNYILQKTLPTQFSGHCRLANIDDTTLIIHTDNASLASLIRFQSPAICKTLSTEFARAITNIEIKVRPVHNPIQNQHTTSIVLPDSAASALLQTAQTIDDGPLKTALEKLAQRRN
ncbi:MAG: DciA family protein [Gammaproteobacteria bacterium]|nr:DciA family protein [Gammaproteobacteria bacterium]